MYSYNLKCEALDIPGGKAIRMKGSTGRPVKNQWVIETDQGTFLQSYNSIIAYRLKKDVGKFRSGQVWLDKGLWNCSNTTARYRRLFLEEGVEDTAAKIQSGVYRLAYLSTGYAFDDLPLE